MSKIVVKNATAGTELIWRRLTVRKSLDDICHTLDMELDPGERAKIHKHDRIEVRYANPLIQDSQRAGGRRVTTVLVDEVTANADTRKHGIAVKGRSPARDIIDSAWSEDFAEMTLLELTRAIGKRFGIQCDPFPQDAQTQTIAAFRLENESPWIKLINAADNDGYVFTSNEAGNLYLWNVAAVTRSEGFKLAEGVNIKSIGWSENGAEQFHEYVIKGGGQEARKIDPACPGGRILTIDITDPDFPPAKLPRRAESEMLRRRENTITVSVPGWGLTDEEIKRLGGVTKEKELFWIPNALIPVNAPSLGLNAKLLISEVEQEATPGAFGSVITLVNRENYL
jgi:prophage tail gpP-like protein